MLRLRYIGSSTVELLIQAGFNVIAYDNLSTGQSSRLNPRATLYIGDLSSVEQLLNFIRNFGVEAIVHCAGLVMTAATSQNPLDFYSENSENTHRLLEACSKGGIKAVVFASSASVYGDHTNELCCEDFSPFPTNPYGRSKLISEWMVRDAMDAFGLNYCILRYFNVAGVDLTQTQANSYPAHAVNILVQTAAGLRPHFEIYGKDYPTRDGSCERDFVHVVDVARANVLALNHVLDKYSHGSKYGETFNVASGVATSLSELIDSAEIVFDRKIKRIVLPRRSANPARLVARISKIQRVLGWKPRFDLEQMLGDSWLSDKNLRNPSLYDFSIGEGLSAKSDRPS